jgi:transcriptional regulator with XRE-family HTH domain
VGDLRAELQEAFFSEKKERGLTQQDVAKQLNVHRSVVNRHLTGEENLTVRKAAEIAKAMGRELRFEVFKPPSDPYQNEPANVPRDYSNQAIAPIGTGTRNRPSVSIPSRKNASAVVITSLSKSVSAE